MALGHKDIFMEKIIDQMRYWILILFCFWLVSCSLKKDKMTISYDDFSYGVKFERDNIKYIASKESEKLGSNKNYFVSISVEKYDNDTVFKCYAECFNTNGGVIGQYYIIQQLSVKHFKGAGIYTQFYANYDFQYDKNPKYGYSSNVGYIQINKFDWNTETGEGVFFIKLINTFEKDTISIYNGVLKKY
jgi:hypothetical protein